MIAGLTQSTKYIYNSLLHKYLTLKHKKILQSKHRHSLQWTLEEEHHNCMSDGQSHGNKEPWAASHCHKDTGETIQSISYITDKVKLVLHGLPGFSNVDKWEKRLAGVLEDFKFMNLLIYLVYRRYKLFDMHSLKAFKSLKAYKYFYDGFVRNVWVQNHHLRHHQACALLQFWPCQSIYSQYHSYVQKH